ncbi:MAG: DUF4143 domain-containing protein [Deltaproteobacteria bacterium]|nr:MAG: DUF4143 domain-containing protein [Deltaproteobacteria bacterium]
MLQELQVYLLIGGLPEAVASYLEEKDFLRVQKVQQSLLMGYREDFHKYASRAQILPLNTVFQSIPRLVGKKFKYSEVHEQLRSRELSAALELLEQAGLAYKVYHSSCQGLPLASQINPKKFKVFSLDIGLCQRLLNVDLAQSFALKQDWSPHKGGLAEQFVAQELVSYGFEQARPELHCWYREERGSQSEMDFVVPLVTKQGTKIIPLEVKSERSHGLRSLGVFLDEKRKNSSFGIVISFQGFKEKEKVKYIPLYAVWMLQELNKKEP